MPLTFVSSHKWEKITWQWVIVHARRLWDYVLTISPSYLTVMNYLDVPITLQEETSAAATSTYNEILVAELVHYNLTFNKSIHTCITQ